MTTPDDSRAAAQRIPSLDGLRGVAVGLVMAFHFSLLYQPGDFFRAIQSTERLTAIGRGNENRHTRIAYSMWQKGMSPRLVLEHYERSLEVRPTALTWIYLGHFHLQPRPGAGHRLALVATEDEAFTRDTDAALDAFRNALALDPTTLDALLPYAALKLCFRRAPRGIGLNQALTWAT